MDKKVVIAVVAVAVVFLAIPLVSKVWSPRPSAPDVPSPSNVAPPGPSAGAASPASVATDLVTALSKGDVMGVSAKLDDAMKAKLPPSKLSESWNALQAQMGAFKGQNVGRINRFDTSNEVHVICEFERGKAEIIVLVNQSLQVSNLEALPAKP